MTTSQTAWPLRTTAWASLALVVTLAACGGSSDDDEPPPVKKVAVSTTVIDGYLGNVLVCSDTNSNGRCDSDEPQATTNANGQATLQVSENEVGRYPLVAMVSAARSSDADGHAITADYTMTTPADATNAITPLTTLVHAHMLATGDATHSSAQAIQRLLALPNSPLQDFIASSDVPSTTMARLLAVATQQLTTATANATDAQGAPLSAERLQQTIAYTLLTQLQPLAQQLQQRAPQNDAELQALATDVVERLPLNASTAGTIDQQLRTPPQPMPVGEAYGNLTMFSYTDANNYVWQMLSATAAQNTPDANGKRYFTEQRGVMAQGQSAAWSTEQFRWTGSDWEMCATDQLHEIQTIAATGEAESSYCGITRLRAKQYSESIAGDNVRETLQLIRRSSLDNANWGPDPQLINANLQWPEGAQLRTNLVNALDGGHFLQGAITMPPADQPTSTDPTLWRNATLDEAVNWFTGDYADGVSASGINGNNALTALSQRWYPKADGSWGYKRYLVAFNSAQKAARFYECEGNLQAQRQPSTLAGSCQRIWETSYTVTALGSSSQVLQFDTLPLYLSYRTKFTLVERPIEGSPRAFRGAQHAAYSTRQMFLNDVAAHTLFDALNIRP